MGRVLTDPFNTQDDAATPLDEDEKSDLVLSYITTRRELNEAEQAHIVDAEQWAFTRKRNVLDARFLDALHKRMLAGVWRWAGTHRRSAKTVGIDAYQIPTEMQRMFDDTRYWIDNGTYEHDEIGARFHHRLVWIHPYPNGNGRHARLATDLLLVSLGQQRFTWGRLSQQDANETRQRYVHALREADKHDFAPLLRFVRS